jgi:hypothetical protein
MDALTPLLVEEAEMTNSSLEHQGNSTVDGGQVPSAASTGDAASGNAIPPTLQETLPSEIVAIIERLHTQDNRITADPLFAVQQKRRIYGVDPERCDAVVWLDETGDYREADAEEHALFEKAETAPDGWYRTGYIDQWEFVTGCFTEQGCKDFIACNGHNLKEPRIYAYGAYRNAEFIALRKWLMSLRPPLAMGAAPATANGDRCEARAAVPASSGPDEQNAIKETP